MTIPAISTNLVLPSSRKVGTSMCCATSSDLIASVYGSCSSVQTPQSGLLHCMPHGKPACHLLGFGALPPRLRDFHPLERPSFWSIFTIQGTHSTYPKGGVSCSNDSFVIIKSLVFQIKFCGKRPALRVAAKRYASL